MLMTLLRLNYSEKIFESLTVIKPVTFKLPVRCFDYQAIQIQEVLAELVRD